MATIVVVEPDFAIRTLLAEWLMAEGYTVKQFSHMTVPRGVFASAEILIVDLPAPRSQRLLPLADMCSSYPGLTAIGLSTSLSRSLAGESAFARSLCLARVLAKPCERRELLDAVREALDRRPA